MKAPNARNRFEQSESVAVVSSALGSKSVHLERERGMKWSREKMSVIALKCFVVQGILPVT